MKPSLLACLVVITSLFTPFSARAQTVYGGAQTLNGLQDRGNTRSNLQLQERRNAELRQSFRAQDIIEDERRKLHPLAPPIVDVTPDAAGDTFATLAKNFRSQYFTDWAPVKVDTYLRARFDDYAASTKRAGLRVSSLASACDYAAESLYAAATHVDATPERLSLRGTCTMVVQDRENSGSLTTNAQRYGLFRAFAIAGSVYRDLDRREAASGDTAKRDFYDGEARTTFEELFHRDIADTPPQKFVCLFATPTTSCDLVQRIYPRFFGEARRGVSVRLDDFVELARRDVEDETTHVVMHEKRMIAHAIDTFAHVFLEIAERLERVQRLRADFRRELLA